MIIGADVGYSHTKVCYETGADIFQSTIEDGTTDINNSIKVEFEGKEFTIGENTGLFSTDLNKINDHIFKLCLYTAIGRAVKQNNEPIELVTGLPVEYYKTQKEELRSSLEGKTINITINGEPKRFIIARCLVFPQSAGLFTLEEFKGDNIVIDIGGLTVDISYFEGLKLSKFKTYELGMLKLYDTLVQTIKSEYGVSYDILKAQDIINNKEIIKDGTVVNANDTVQKVLKKHSERILKTVKNGLTEYDTAKRIFTGGGAINLKDYLPTDKLDNKNIFDNAKSFYLIGVRKFEN